MAYFILLSKHRLKRTIMSVLKRQESHPQTLRQIHASVLIVKKNCEN
jgi:hypothetical protein